MRDSEIVPKTVKYWVEVDPETYNPTGNICWVYFEGDRPVKGFWIECQETGKTNSLVVR